MVDSLLTPAFEALGSECLTGGWTEYVSLASLNSYVYCELTSLPLSFFRSQDWAPAIAMMSVYAIFFAEVAAYRIGNKKMEKLGLTYNTHAVAEAEHGHSHEHPQAGDVVSPIGSSEEGVESNVGTGNKAKMAEAGYASSDSLDADVARTD